MGDMGLADAQRIARDDTRATLRHWKVAKSPAPSSSTFGVEDLDGVPITLGSSAASALVGATLEFRTGILGGTSGASPATPRQAVEITATGTGGDPATVTVTVESGLSAAPAAGDEFVIVPPIPGALALLDSTTTALGSDGTYTTANAVLVSQHKTITGSAYSDQSGTLLVEQSPDGTNWDVQSTVTVTGSSASSGFEVTVVAKYARLSYTNGSTAQTSFRLYAWGKRL